MTEELRERIAHWLQKHTDYAGNLEWYEFDEDAQEGFRCRADQIHALYKEAGYVQLAEDQSLPQVTEQARTDHKWVAAFTCGITEMLKAGWRKVELAEEG